MMRYLGLIFWCSVAAVLTAAFVGDELTLSLRIWLAAFAGWFAVAQFVRVLSDTTLAPSRIRLLAARARKQEVSYHELHEFRSLESLLLRSRDNERAHRQQLQPRLTALADHFLLVHHGINRLAQPERAAVVLGDVGWLIDDDETTSAPTLEDIDEFLDRILPKAQTNPEKTA